MGFQDFKNPEINDVGDFDVFQPSDVEWTQYSGVMTMVWLLWPTDTFNVFVVINGDVLVFDGWRRGRHRRVRLFAAARPSEARARDARRRARGRLSRTRAREILDEHGRARDESRRHGVTPASRGTTPRRGAPIQSMVRRSRLEPEGLRPLATSPDPW